MSVVTTFPISLSSNQQSTDSIGLLDPVMQIYIFCAIGVLLSVVLFTTILIATVLLLKLLDRNSVSCSTGKTNPEFGISRNKINESVWKKHQVINERIITKNTRAKPKSQRKSKQEIDTLCKRKTEKLYLIFIKNLAVNLKYEPLFDDMKALKCFFVSFCFFVYHCVKCVRMRVFSDLFFPRFCATLHKK